MIKGNQAKKPNSANVVADPLHPALLSTDLALDKLWNRVFTLATFVPLGLGLAFGALVLAMVY